VSPATEARELELAARRSAQAEAEAERARREANAQAALAAEAAISGPKAEAPSAAWVSGPATPAYGGPGAGQDAPEPTAVAEEPEVGL